MKIPPSLSRLEELPNIGPRIAADLRALGIRTPEDLAHTDPLETYERLAEPMGKRHDPCVFHTLLAVEHFFASGEALVWWKFTEEGKRRLRERP
ncbi:MAG: helix-hairpin-helix domain-containing protein [Verrucomicrobiota bacterium]